MSDTVTGLDIDRLEELAEKATPGPWGVGNGDTIATKVEQTSRGGFRFGQIIARLDDTDYLEANEDADDVEDQMSDDAEFIAAMRNAAPSLLAAARHVEAVRVAVHLDDGEPINLPAVPGGYKQPFCDGWDAAVDHMRGLVRAALGTE